MVEAIAVPQIYAMQTSKHSDRQRGGEIAQYQTDPILTCWGALGRMGLRSSGHTHKFRGRSIVLRIAGAIRQHTGMYL